MRGMSHREIVKNHIFRQSMRVMEDRESLEEIGTGTTTFDQEDNKNDQVEQNTTEPQTTYEDSETQTDEEQDEPPKKPTN